jgi:predicted DNA-binding antitoxin AbrB/MazE fold protein
MTTIEAVYEHGVLRLLQPLALAEGTHVEVNISVANASNAQRAPADILTEIAALPLENATVFGNRDHDDVLYGKRIA